MVEDGIFREFSEVCTEVVCCLQQDGTESLTPQCHQNLCDGFPFALICRGGSDGIDMY